MGNGWKTEVKWILIRAILIFALVVILCVAVHFIELYTGWDLCF